MHGLAIFWFGRGMVSEGRGLAGQSRVSASEVTERGEGVGGGARNLALAKVAGRRAAVTGRGIELGGDGVEASGGLVAGIGHAGSLFMVVRGIGPYSSMRPTHGARWQGDAGAVDEDWRLGIRVVTMPAPLVRWS